MTLVVFVRNVNLGQRGHPSAADLLGAFAAAGAPGAVSVHSNGTVIVSSSDSGASDPAALAEAVGDALEAATGIRRAVFALPLEVVATIVDEHADRPDSSRRELTVHAAPTPALDDPAALDAERRGRCSIDERGERDGTAWAVVVNDVEWQSNGTPVLERFTGGPATSRSLATMRRVAEHSRERAIGSHCLVDFRLPDAGDCTRFGSRADHAAGRVSRCRGSGLSAQ